MKKKKISPIWWSEHKGDEIKKANGRGEALMEDLLKSMACIAPRGSNDLEDKFSSDSCLLGLRPYRKWYLSKISSSLP